MGRFFQTNKDGSVKFTPELAAEHSERVRELRRLTDKVEENSRWLYRLQDVQFRMNNLEERFDAVLELLHIEVEEIPTKLAHYKAKHRED